MKKKKRIKGINDYDGDLTRRWYAPYKLHGISKRLWLRGTTAEDRHAYYRTEIEKIETENKKIVCEVRLACFRFLESDRFKPKSKATYKVDVILFANYLNSKGIHKIEKIKPKMILNFFDTIREKYHINTLSGKLKNLKAVFNGMKSKLFKDLPLTFIKVESKRHVAYTPADRIRLEAVMQKDYPELYLLTRFVYYGFIRPNSELLRLKVSDIDLRLETIRISTTIGKMGKSRLIPIVKPFKDLIETMNLDQFPSNYFVFGEGLKPSDKKCYYNYSTSLNQKACIQAKCYVPNCSTIYAWKHTGNINAYLAGMDLKMLQVINGHASSETTEIYLRNLGLFLDRKIKDFVF